MANNGRKRRQEKEVGAAAAGQGQNDDGAWRLVGMDVHKEHCQVCIETELGVVLERRYKTQAQELDRVFGASKSMKVLMEASTESEWVAQRLESLGHQVVVADPNYAAMYGTRSRKIKTDRRDAAALLDALRSGTYRPAHRRSEPMRDIRVQLLIRDHLVGARSKSISLCRSVLRQYGVGIPGGEAETFVMRGEPLVTVEAVGQGVKEAVSRVLKEIKELDEQIEQMDQELTLKTKEQPQVQILMSTPGVGPVVGLGVMALIDQEQRFQRSKQVGSYLGLVPGEHSSGEGKKRTRITKTGDGMVRRLLVQAAHSLMRSKKPEAAGLQQWAGKIKERSGRSVAAVALARKLAGILWAMMRDGTQFGDQANKVAQRRAA